MSTHMSGFSTQLPSQTPAPQVCKIPHDSYPHIVEAVLAHSDYKTLLTFRSTCTSLNTAVKRTMSKAGLKILLEQDSGDSTIVLCSGVGTLPFGRQDWASVLEHSEDVQVDGRFLSSLAFTSDAGLPGTPLDQLAVPPREMEQPVPGGLKLRDDKVALWLALDHIPRSANVKIMHTDGHSPLEFIPPVAHLTIVVNPSCACMCFIKSRNTLTLSHTASHLTIVFHPSWDVEVEDSGGLESFALVRCNVSTVLFQPTVEHLILSVSSIWQASFALSMMGRKQSPENKHVTAEIRIRKDLTNIQAHPCRHREAFARFLGLPVEQVQVALDETGEV